MSTFLSSSSDVGSSLPPKSRMTIVSAAFATLAATTFTYSGISLWSKRILPNRYLTSKT